MKHPRISRPCRLAVLTLAAQAWAISAQAQSLLTPSDGMLVTASRSQARVEQMPLNTTVISQEDIQKSAALTLDQLLRNVPGLNFTAVPAVQSDPTGHQTKMRGMGNAKVLVLLDGVPVMDPFYLTTQWFKVPLSNIERIEVIRGGNSSIWGNMAVAGVIHIVSKTGQNDAGVISATTGTAGTTQLALNKNFKVSDTLSLSINLDQLDYKGYVSILPQQLYRYAAWHPNTAVNTHAQLTAFFQPSADWSGYVRAGYHVQDQDIGYVNGSNLQKSPDASASVTQRLNVKSSVTAAAWSQYVNFEKYNGATCYWQTTGTKCPSNVNVTPAQVNANVVQYYSQYGSQKYREQGASAIYATRLDGLWRDLQLGLDYRNLSAKDLEFFYAAPTALVAGGLNPVKNLNSSTFGAGDQKFTGLFVQTKVAPVPALEITLSARHDNWDNSGRTNTRSTAAGVTYAGAQADNNQSAVNPSAAARYQITDDAALRAAVYKSFRAPGFNNTTRTYGANGPTIANPDLGPENLKGRELGLDFKQDPFSLSATYFQYDISNMIATYKISSYASAPALVQTICGASLSYCAGTASFYSNEQDGLSRGLELQAQWKINKDLSVDAGLVHTTSILTRKAANITTPLNLQLTGTPINMANVGVTWLPLAGLRTYLQARYVGRMYYDVNTAGGPYEQGGNVIYDASASYAVSKATDLSLSVANLANKQYSENAYTSGQPYGITLSMPRIVNLGLKIKF
jgi:iron complex outermembrane receptor protein